MSKRIDISLTILELKIIQSALAIGEGKELSRLMERIEETIDRNQEPHELTHEEYVEKYGPFHGDDEVDEMIRIDEEKE